jgi:DNA-binding HxlR family transcriptional regulator/putative sterol carrier protein
MMPKHGYQQYCGLARALDIAGDRWTLLIVRELLPGARRFTDLIDGLPGISRKLLTERLRDLERHGVIARRELPPPAARQVYELSEDGRDLAWAMAPLVGWGAGRLGKPGPGASFRARWVAVGMVSVANRKAAAGVRETYQYQVGDCAFHFTVNDGLIELHDGRVKDPAVLLNTDEESFAKIVSGELTASSALRSGALTVAGGRQARKRLGEIFSHNQLFTQARTVASGAGH